MSFGDLLYYKNAPAAINMLGIGGDNLVIWASRNIQQVAYKLEPITCSVIKSTGFTYGKGIGGKFDIVWAVATSGSSSYFKVLELNTDDLSVVRAVNAFTHNPYDIGGDANRVWMTNSDGELYSYISELNPSDLSVIYYGTPPAAYPSGVGGSSERIWTSNKYTDLLYELDPDTLAIRRYTTVIMDGGIGGTGGDDNYIYVMDITYGKIYILDPAIPGPILQNEHVKNVKKPANVVWDVISGSFRYPLIHPLNTDLRTIEPSKSILKPDLFERQQ